MRSTECDAQYNEFIDNNLSPTCEKEGKMRQAGQPKKHEWTSGKRAARRPNSSNTHRLGSFVSIFWFFIILDFIIFKLSFSLRCLVR